MVREVERLKGNATETKGGTRGGGRTGVSVYHRRMSPSKGSAVSASVVI